MICESCGATAAPGSGSFCSHCGRRLGAPTALPVAMVVSGASALTSTTDASTALDPTALPAPPSKLGDRFAVARRDPGYQAALSTRVSTRSGTHVAQLLVALAFMASGVTFGGLWFSMAPGVMVVFGALFLCVWLGATGSVAWHAVRKMTGQQTSALACVIGKESVPVVHHREHGHVTTLRSQVTVELEDGRRLVLDGAHDVIGALIEDDVGVAYMQGTRLLGFRRLAT